MGLELFIFFNIYPCDWDKCEVKFKIKRGVDQIDRAKEFPEGVYTGELYQKQKIGTHSLYVRFKEMLSLGINSLTLKELQKTPQKYNDLPFYEILDFSSTEGVLGTKVCEKLAKDFSQYKLEFQEFTEDSQDIYKIYLTLELLFKKASEKNGIIIFS